MVVTKSKVCCMPTLKAMRPDADVSGMFEQAVGLECSGETVEAKALYWAILRRYPEHGASLINLGALSSRDGDHREAERLFRRATEVDSRYALAWFNLGAELEDLGRQVEAVAAYERSVGLNPQYADTHYNLALLLQRLGRPLEALPHWKMYCKLDPSEPYAGHARRMRRLILERTGISIVARRDLGDLKPQLSLFVGFTPILEAR